MLPSTRDEDWAAIWPALLQTCRALGKREAWRAVCSDATGMNAPDGAQARQFFATRFDGFRLLAETLEDGRLTETRSTGLVTGYYEPVLAGSRTQSAHFASPLYRVPSDLLVIDLASVYPELASLRLRGKLQGRRVVPYPTRGEVSGGNLLAGQELLWVDDPVEAFFLQVQGSGRIRFEDGTTIRVGFADQNGHPYKSIGRWLIEQGELAPDQASMQGIKAWVARNPTRVRELLDTNPSFVFFRELPLGDPAAGPVGALGVPLTPRRSVAADPRYIPLGAPIVLATTDPVTRAPLARPLLVQDTGGAIRGPLRFDFFWGPGAEAGEIAGRQRYDGSAWLLVPKGTSPEELLRR
jgi:membrane-bound lytic murein transglycosylase A